VGRRLTERPSLRPRDTALAAILGTALRDEELRRSWPWLAGAMVAVIIVAPGGIDPLNHVDLLWFWRVLVVAPGILLAAEPLLSGARQTPSHPGVWGGHDVTSPASGSR